MKPFEHRGFEQVALEALASKVEKAVEMIQKDKRRRDRRRIVRCVRRQAFHAAAQVGEQGSVLDLSTGQRLQFFDKGGEVSAGEFGRCRQRLEGLQQGPVQRAVAPLSPLPVEICRRPSREALPQSPPVAIDVVDPFEVEEDVRLVGAELQKESFFGKLAGRTQIGQAGAMIAEAPQCLLVVSQLESR